MPSTGGEFAADQIRPSNKRTQLGVGEIARQRGHAAIRARMEPLDRNEVERPADRRGDLFRRFHGFTRHVDRANQHVLAGQERQERGVARDAELFAKALARDLGIERLDERMADRNRGLLTA